MTKIDHLAQNLTPTVFKLHRPYPSNNILFTKPALAASNRPIWHRDHPGRLSRPVLRHRPPSPPQIRILTPPSPRRSLIRPLNNKTRAAAPSSSRSDDVSVRMTSHDDAAGAMTAARWHRSPGVVPPSGSDRWPGIPGGRAPRTVDDFGFCSEVIC